MSARKALAQIIKTLSPASWNKFLIPLQLLTHGNYSNLGEKLHKGSELLEITNDISLYHRIISQWNDPAAVVLSSTEPLTTLTNPRQQPQTDAFFHQMMALDMLTYLPDDILCKVDRAAMAASLETRIPFLDHRVVEFAWRLPLPLKVHDGQCKWLLRQVLYRYVPKELMERPKMGFGVPIDKWLRGPLRDWAESLLNESRLKQEGYFNPKPIRKKWLEHLSGQHNWEFHLWDVLMFQAWLENEKHNH